MDKVQSLRVEFGISVKRLSQSLWAKAWELGMGVVTLFTEQNREGLTGIRKIALRTKCFLHPLTSRIH